MSVFKIICGIYLVILAFILLVKSVKNKQSIQTIEFGYYFLTPALCLWVSIYLLPISAPLLFALTAAFGYFLYPIDQGLYEFARMHGFENCDRYSFYGLGRHHGCSIFPSTMTNVMLLSQKSH